MNYLPSARGTLNIAVTSHGKSLSKSPYTVPVKSLASSQYTEASGFSRLFPTCDIIGPGIISATEDAPTYFIVTPRDKNNEVISDSASQIKTHVVDSNGKDISIFIT